MDISNILNVPENVFEEFLEKLKKEFGKSELEKMVYDVAHGKISFLEKAGDGKAYFYFKISQLEKKLREKEDKDKLKIMDYHNKIDEIKRWKAKCLIKDKDIQDLKAKLRNYDDDFDYYLRKSIEYERLLSVYGLEELKILRGDYDEEEDEEDEEY